ncbi:MAG: nuclear transport factor 2 family protein [Acetobacteraceae bacterium]
MTEGPSRMTLEERIRRLEDIEEIRRLRNRYHAALNESRYGECRALFTDDAIVELGYLARYEGIEAIDRGFRAMGERERFFIKQFIHSHDVDVDGDTGTGTSYLEARYGRFGVSYVVAGRYDDVYARVNGVWKFKAMIAELFYTVPNGVGWTGDEMHYLRPRK